MTPELLAWCARYGIVNPQARADLMHIFAGQIGYLPPEVQRDLSESGVQSRLRLSLAMQGCLVWRNNVGAMEDANGRVVRFGIANDSAAVNRQIKSSDLLGIRPGGRFMARECKPTGWVYAGTEREVAQLRFLKLIADMGGDAAFHNGVDCPVN